MNAPTAEAARLQSIEAEDRMRIATACRIASGMLANPHTYEQPDWRNAIAFESVLMADKIISQVRQS